MFSRWMFATTAAAIICFSVVTAVPLESTEARRPRRTRDIVSSNVLPLRRASRSLRRRRSLGVAGHKSKRDDGSYAWAKSPLSWQDRGQNLVTTIMINGQDFNVLVDTASSDTWIAADTVNCISPTSLNSTSQSTCKFGSLYHTTLSTQFLPQSLNITYGDGQFVTGIMTKETLTIASITVTQELGIVTQASWQGDDTTSGILGLAFPSITNAFAGIDPHTASGATQIPYSPFSTTLFATGIVNPYFSLALDRPNGDGSAAGFLAFGGIPAVDLAGDFVSAPLLNSTTSFFNGTAVAPEHQFYSILTDGFVYEKRLNSRSTAASSTDKVGKEAVNANTARDFEVIIGSASNFLFLPTKLADEINGLFSGPVVKSRGMYTVPCDATPPTIGVQISDAVFWIQAADLVLRQADGTCWSGVADAGEGKGARYELGDVFLQNVVAVFDVGQGEMRFAPRKYNYT